MEHCGTAAANMLGSEAKPEDDGSVAALLLQMSYVKQAADDERSARNAQRRRDHVIQKMRRAPAPQHDAR